MELIRKYTHIHFENYSYAYFPEGRPQIMAASEDLADIYLSDFEMLEVFTPEMERQAMARARAQARANSAEEEMLRINSEIDRQLALMAANEREREYMAKCKEIDIKQRDLKDRIKLNEKKDKVCSAAMIIACILIAIAAVFVVIDLFKYPYGVLLLPIQAMFIMRKNSLAKQRAEMEIEEIELSTERMDLMFRH